MPRPDRPGAGGALRLLGWGIHDPGVQVLSTEIDARLGKPSGWSERATGVHVRRFIDPGAGETASAMAESAARCALEVAGVRPEQLSAVLGASGVMEQAIPGTSVLLHRRLGLAGSGVPALDVNATCLSFVAALQMAALHIGAGLWDRVLIASSDVASAGLDEDDPATAPLFGDGAAAFIVGRSCPGESSALLAWRHETYSEGADAAWLGAGGSRLPLRDLEAFAAEAHFRMDGVAAYRIVVERLPPFVGALCEDAGAALADIKMVVLHQASGHAMSLIGRRLGLPPDRTVHILRERGNQVAASIPTALACGLDQGRVERGDRVLLLGTGAGVSIGGAVLVF